MVGLDRFWYVLGFTSGSFSKKGDFNVEPNI